jgi:hypothetical protein
MSAFTKNLEADANEIRMRATRKLDQLRVAQKATVGLNVGTAGKGRPSLGGVFETPPKDDRPTLTGAGIDKNLAKRARTLGELSDEEFEAAVKENRARIADEGRSDHAAHNQCRGAKIDRKQAGGDT